MDTNVHTNDYLLPLHMTCFSFLLDDNMQVFYRLGGFGEAFSAQSANSLLIYPVLCQTDPFFFPPWEIQDLITNTLLS